MIVFKNLTKMFNGNLILNDISGEFKSEKINMVIGHSGAGKTILSKCILGLIPVDKGTIFFNDEEMQYDDKDPILKTFRSKIGVLSQKPVFHSSKTVEENIMLFLGIVTDLTQAEKKDRVYECLELVGMKPFAHRYPGELSGGMQKKIGLACAISHSPLFLFCDEPDSGLDPENSDKIDSLIKSISKKTKMTTVIVTHNLDSVIKIGENIMFLNGGKKHWEGSCKDLFENDNAELNRFLRSSSMFKKYQQLVIENRLE